MKTFTIQFVSINACKGFVRLCLLIAVIVFLYSSVSLAQNKTLIKRTTYKNEKIEFGVGGTVAVVGAPEGSITIEGWQKNEIEISAEIEVQAEIESDLEQLAKIDGFVLDQDFGHVRIISVGTNDKDYLKRIGKKLPKNLLEKPYKIDYRIKVPAFCDLEINGGRGDLMLSGVEGAMQIKILQGNGNMTLTGGAVSAVFGNGNVDVNIASRSWRGRNADFQLAGGTLNVKLLPNLNADINASILRTGKIENTVAALKPRMGNAAFTEKTVAARAGNGGASLSFTVGDGTLIIKN